MSDRSLAAQAAEQHGLFSVQQVRASGLSHAAASRRLSSGRWLSVHRGVYRVAGTPETWHGRMMAATLAAGEDSMASHRSARRLWALGKTTEFCEIVVPYDHERRLRGVGIHRCNLLLPVDRRVVESIPVTGPELTLLQLGSILPPWTIDGLVDDAINRGLTILPKLRWRLKELGKQGRNGCGVLREVLDARDPEAAAAATKLERALHRIVKHSSLPNPQLQHVIRAPDGRFIGRVDAAWPEHRVVVEAEGAEWHAALKHWAKDMERQNDLEAHGWSVFRFSYWQVIADPDYVLRTLTSRLSR